MLEWITSIINSMSYLGIAFLMFLENIFPPIPSEVVMPLAGFTATQGKLNIVFVILAGTAGTVVGALPWYYLGSHLGEKRIKGLADKYGKWLTVSSADIDKAKKWFEKHGGKAVMLCHLVPGIRTFISVPAGINRMNWVPFLIYTALGGGFWVGVLAIAGYTLGNNYQAVEKYASPASKILLVALVIAFIAWIWRRQTKRKDKREVELSSK